MQKSHSFLGHPYGLLILSLAEMAERFCAVGLKSFLLFSMIALTSGDNPGFGLNYDFALGILALYGAFASFSPIFGGKIADWWVSPRQCARYGCLIMAFSQVIMAFSVYNQYLVGFFIGLFFLIVGGGAFRPNINVLVRDLYKEGDLRIESAFVYFYMAINIGAIFAPLLCASLAESSQFGWFAGHVCAGLAVFLGYLVITFFSSRYLAHVGHVSNCQLSENQVGIRIELTQREKNRLWALGVIFIFIMLSYIGFEQIFGVMALYIQENIDRSVLGYTIPAGWFISLNPIFVCCFAPIINIFLIRMAKYRGKPFTTVQRIITALIIMSVGYGILSWMSYFSCTHILWIVFSNGILAIGEIFIAPSAISLVTILAPRRILGYVNGLSFLAVFFAHLCCIAMGLFFSSLGYLLIFCGISFVLLIGSVFLFSLKHTLDRWIDD